MPGLFERLRGAGEQTRLPIFVFGLPRSGTTLVEQILASHSRVHGAGEVMLAAEAFESIPRLLGRKDEGISGCVVSCLESLDAPGVGEMARRYLDGLTQTLKQVAPDRELPPDRIVDKMPDNYLYIGMLALLFPRATFISVRRDLRDVALSCWMTSFQSIRWADDQENIAARFRDYRRLMDHWQTILPVRMHEAAYEQLVDDFDTEAPRLLAACGLDWEEAAGNSTGRLVPCGRAASCRSVNRSIARLWDAGRTTNARWRVCSSACRLTSVNQVACNKRRGTQWHTLKGAPLIGERKHDMDFGSERTRVLKDNSGRLTPRPKRRLNDSVYEAVETSFWARPPWRRQMRSLRIRFAWLAPLTSLS